MVWLYEHEMSKVVDEWFGLVRWAVIRKNSLTCRWKESKKWWKVVCVLVVGLWTESLDSCTTAPKQVSNSTLNQKSSTKENNLFTFLPTKQTYCSIHITNSSQKQKMKYQATNSWFSSKPNVSQARIGSENSRYHLVIQTESTSYSAASSFI